MVANCEIPNADNAICPTRLGKSSSAIWNYPGPFGQEIESALALERTDEYAHHLLLPDELEAYLKRYPYRENFGCLDDSSSCEQEAQGILNLLGFQARVDAVAVRDGEAYRVKLTILRADSGQRRVFQVAAPM